MLPLIVSIRTHTHSSRNYTILTDSYLYRSDSRWYYAYTGNINIKLAFLCLFFDYVCMLAAHASYKLLTLPKMNLSNPL